MIRTSLLSSGLCALALLAACSSGTQGPAETPEPPAPADAPADQPEAEPTPAPADEPVPADEPAPADEPSAAGEPSTRIDEPNTRDGIYTLAQAERGERVYEELCSECHDTEDWTETAFLGRWQDQSTFQLWYYINDRMPYDNPWSLSRQQVTDVLTYILHLNDLPTGEEELGTDDDSIDQYWIVWD